MAGWFSFEDGHATAGDLLTRDLACEWLDSAGYAYDVAVAPPFTDGVDLRGIDPDDYSHLVFVCGPFEQGALEAAVLGRFSRSRLIGLNLSMQLPIDVWNPFDLLLERDSTRAANPDIAFLASRPPVPVVGVCLVEPHPGAIDHTANAAIRRLTASRELACVTIDTRLDLNTAGLRSAAEVESLIARMDVVVTTRLHGMVLALKHGVPAISIDPIPGGAKIRRQAETIGWPVAFNADAVTDESLQQALDFCLSEAARTEAVRCAERARRLAGGIRDRFVAALVHPAELEHRYRARLAARAELPLVSVIIPCYKQAQFLAEAIESVLAQEYPRLEVIVVDDGSPDDTAAVARRYPTVRYIRQDNRTLPVARNTGWQASTGEFLAFLDADDLLLPGALEAGARALLAHPDCAFVSGDYQYVNADGSFLRRHSPRFVEDRHYEALLRGNYIGMHATVMYRRPPLAEAGGFDPTLPACEDYDLYLRIARRHRIACHSAVVAAYRQHGTNMSGDPALMLRAALRVVRAQARHVQGDPSRRRALAEGVAGWRSLYAEPLIGRVLRLGRDGARGRALLAAGTLLRNAPGLTARVIYRKAGRRARRLTRRALEALTPPAIRRPGRPHLGSPPVGRVRFGDLRRLVPISRQFGFDRGLPIDRYYIEQFLERHAGDIRGRVLEIGDDAYTRRFGGDRVTTRDVLHVDAGNPLATFVADLTTADHIPSDLFDCIILTQTLHLIYDLRAAVRTLHRLLKPGGVLLLTVPGISQLSTDRWAGAWHWAFTEQSTRRLFGELFPEGCLRTEVHGNVLAATAFLQGLAASELSPVELDDQDRQYQLLITLRAAKALV